MLSIKNALPDDIKTIIDLTLKIWPQTYSHILADAQIAYMLDMMYSPAVLEKQMKNGHTFIICQNNNEPVGFAGYSQTGPDTFKLHKIYVLPDKQGMGIGRFLLDHIIGGLKEKDITYLELNVNRYNDRAKSFYEKTGFTIYRDEDIDIGNGYYMNDHVLRLQL